MRRTASSSTSRTRRTRRSRTSWPPPTRPVLASHTGLRRTCDNGRNLTDAEALGVAATGGVLGIGFWDTVTCGSTTADVARAIRDAVDLVGAEHVALGSDWDGAVPVPFDASETGSLTQALLDAGLDEPAIRAVMGENVVRLLGEVLPARGVTPRVGQAVC